MSWKIEVLAYGETKWCSNALRFATKEETARYGSDLFTRWTGAEDIRAVKSPDPVNSVWRDGRVVGWTEVEA